MKVLLCSVRIDVTKEETKCESKREKLIVPVTIQETCHKHIPNEFKGLGTVRRHQCVGDSRLLAEQVDEFAMKSRLFDVGLYRQILQANIGERWRFSSLPVVVRMLLY